MKRAIILFSLFNFVFLFSTAQTTTDILYLNNGSVIKGRLIQENDTIVRIQTTGENIFAFDPRVIKEIKRDTVTLAKASVKESGFFKTFSAGFLLGQIDDEHPAAFTALFEGIYKYKEKYAVGAFLGFEQIRENVIPMGVTLKFMLPLGRSDFIIGFSGAYVYPVEKAADEYINKSRGGMAGSSELGLTVPLGEGCGFFASMGYQYLTLNYEIEDYWLSEYERRITFNRFLIRLGITIF